MIEKILLKLYIFHFLNWFSFRTNEIASHDFYAICRRDVAEISNMFETSCNLVAILGKTEVNMADQ